jgi:hypothetical protein
MYDRRMGTREIGSDRGTIKVENRSSGCTLVLGKVNECNHGRRSE